MLYLYLTIYVLVLIAVSWLVSRKETSEGFLIADRNRKWWIIAISKFAGAIGAGYFITYTGYAYEYGLGVYVAVLGALVGYGLFGLWATPRIHKNAHDKKFYTQGDYVLDRTKSTAAQKITNHIGNLVLFGWLMVGAIGGAKVISHFGLVSYELALVGTVAFVTLYILIAGFRAVLVTDIFQGVIIVALVGALTWTMTKGVGLGNVFAAQTGSIDIITTIGFLLFGVLSVFSYSNFYQLVYAAKDARAAKTGITSSLLPIVFVATLLLMMGLYMFTQNPGLDSGLVFLHALADHLPASLLPIGIVLFFAGLMSSADTNVYAISSHYVLAGKTPSDSAVKKIRYGAIILGGLTIILGLLVRDVVDMTIFAAAFTVVLSVGMIYIIAGGKNAYRFVGSVTAGVVCCALGFIFIGPEPSVIVPVIVGSIIGLGAGGFFQKSKKAGHTPSPADPNHSALT